MGWQGAMRSLGAELRRQERAALRAQREADRAYKLAVKASAADRARYEVAAFETRIEALVTIHRESADRMDWVSLRDRPEPNAPAQPPSVSRAQSEAARAALAEYRPGFFAKLFGLKGERNRLQAALEDAETAERLEETAARTAHEDASVKWKESVETWQNTREIAARVLARDEQAFG